jgi:metallophosphoesterase superfamily enzyme
MPSIGMEVDKAECKVLKISDTHLVNGKTKNDLKTLSYLASVLSKISCDLIILNGDLVDGFTLNFSFNKYTAIDAFAQIVENRGIFWTFVPGNNDREMQGNNREMIAYLMQFEHFMTGNTLDADGDVNFVIDIERKGTIL